MQEEDVLASDVVAHLPDRLEKGQRLDVTDGAADLGDDDVHVVSGHRADPGLDLVGDVRDHLHGVAEVLPAPFLGDHGGVDLPGGHVGRAVQVAVEEALVVAHVEVGLRAVVGDEDLAVLERVHRARVDVEIGVELLHGDPQSAGAQQVSETGRREALADGGGDAARHEDVLGRLRRGQWGLPWSGVRLKNQSVHGLRDYQGLRAVAADHAGQRSYVSRTAANSSSSAGHPWLISRPRAPRRSR